MELGERLLCYYATPQLREEEARAYVRAAKYMARAPCAIGIAQSLTRPDHIRVFIEDHPWQEDQDLAELTLRILGPMKIRAKKLEPSVDENKT